MSRGIKCGDFREKGVTRYGTLALLLLLSAPGVHAGSLSGKEIMTRNEEARRIQDVHSDAMIVTKGPDIPERVKRFTWWRKLTTDGNHFNTLTRFHFPGEVRGEGILFLEHGQNQNEVLMYLPNFKKIRRVESQQQSGSFMGSEFSYSDISTPHAEDYTHKFLREEACGTDEAKGLTCRVVESIPVSDEVKERTGYSKTLAWVRPDNDMIVRAEYTNLEGVFFKKLEASEIKQVDPTRKKWMAHRIHLENLKNRHSTTLHFSNAKVNQGIADSTFTQQNLSKIH